MLRLSIGIRGDDAREPRTVEVSGDQVLLGRAATCDVVLEGREQGASAEHARIQRLGGTYYVIDLGSTNGTALNGTRIRPSVNIPLANNDKVYIGRWLLRVEVPRMTTQHWHRGLGWDPRAEALIAKLQGGGEDPAGLREALERGLEAAEPYERASLLRQVEAQVKDGPAQEVVATEIERRDAIREACYQAMTGLSAHLTGEERFSDPEEVLRFFRLADQTLELSLEWISGCISSRRTFEDRFSAKVTRFFGLETNPIKHALTPAQVGSYLLNWTNERDAEQIKKNLEEVLRDLTAHQLAILAGVQQALKQALGKLDPAEQEQRASASGWLGGPFARSRAWTRFKETYQDLVESESKLFNEVVYPSIRQAYLEAHEGQLGGDGADRVGASDGPDGTVTLEDGV